MRILLVAYDCSPDSGSEAENSWNWAVRLARSNEVVVITHPRWRTTIEAEMERHSSLKLSFEFSTIAYPLDPWKRFDGELLKEFRYTFWQFAALKTGRRLHREKSFDFVHHLSWGSLTAPTLAPWIGPPFIWGPVGGGQVAPLSMRRYLVKGFGREFIRNARVRNAASLPWVRSTARRASVIFAVNSETKNAFEALGATPTLMPCAALHESWLIPIPDKPRRITGKHVLIWAGRIETHKAPTLAIDAFAELAKEIDAELWFLGAGSLLGACQRYAADRLLGKIPRDEVRSHLLEGTALLFTSLRDSFPPVILEAMGLRPSGGRFEPPRSADVSS